MKDARIRQTPEGLKWLEPEWPAPARVRAVSSTRLGGVSQGPYASLNLGRSGGDESAAVTENRRRLFDALGLPAEPSWIKQVHGPRAVCAPMNPPEPEADASYTRERGVVCLVQTADCLPVLFCDDAGSVVGAAHAGWRGLCAGVLEETIKGMGVAPPSLMAWMGPAIGPAAFEVGAEVRAAFIDKDPAAAQAFVPGAAPGKFYADLYELARQRLVRAGVQRIYGGGWCTHADAENFFSYRRDGASGRMAHLIWLAS